MAAKQTLSMQITKGWETCLQFIAHHAGDWTNLEYEEAVFTAVECDTKICSALIERAPKEEQARLQLFACIGRGLAIPINNSYLPDIIHEIVFFEKTKMGNYLIHTNSNVSKTLEFMRWAVKLNKVPFFQAIANPSLLASDALCAMIETGTVADCEIAYKCCPTWPGPPINLLKLVSTREKCAWMLAKMLPDLKPLQLEELIAYHSRNSPALSKVFISFGISRIFSGRSSTDAHAWYDPFATLNPANLSRDKLDQILLDVVRCENEYLAHCIADANLNGATQFMICALDHAKITFAQQIIGPKISDILEFCIHTHNAIGCEYAIDCGASVDFIYEQACKSEDINLLRLALKYEPALWSKVVARASQGYGDQRERNECWPTFNWRAANLCVRVCLESPQQAADLIDCASRMGNYDLLRFMSRDPAFPGIIAECVRQKRLTTAMIATEYYGNPEGKNLRENIQQCANVLRMASIVVPLVCQIYTDEQLAPPSTKRIKL